MVRGQHGGMSFSMMYLRSEVNILLLIACIIRCSASYFTFTEQNNNEDQCDVSAGEECPKSRDFTIIDRHALQTPRTAEASLESLAQYLITSAKDDVEKARAIYRWICENIKYDVEAFYRKKKALTKAEDVLKYKLCICEGYSNIFDALCKEAGIKSKKIIGYSRGASHTPGRIITYNDETNHTWNVVFIEEKWQLIDATWGAGSASENGTFEKEFSDFYFLTKPEHFIVDHMPYMDSDMQKSQYWQLLKQPISIEQFSSAIKLTKYAQTWGVKFYPHATEVISMSENCEIFVESTDIILFDLMYTFVSRTGEFHNSSVAIIRINKFKFKIVVQPQEVGNFTLHIYGKVNEAVDSETPFKLLVDYLIRCSAVSSHIHPFPNNTASYGAKTSVQILMDEISSFHSVTAGYQSLTVKVSTAVKMMATLETYSEKLNRHTAVERNLNVYVVRILVPEEGYYKLILWTLSQNKTFTVATTILFEVLKKMEDVNLSLFPSFEGFYGPEIDITNRGYANEKLIPSSLVAGSDHLYCSIDVKRPIDVMATLTKNNETLERYVAVEQNVNKLLIRILLPEKGFYILSIWSTNNNEFYTVDINILIKALSSTVLNENSLFPNHKGYFGPKLNATERGFLKWDRIPSSLLSETGELVFIIDIDPAYAFLSSLMLNGNDVKRQVALEVKSNKLTIRVIVPYEGFYHLVIWSTKFYPDYTVAADFLLESVNHIEVDEKALFPDFNGYYGLQQNFASTDFIHKHHIPTSLSTNNGSLVFSLAIEIDVKILATLTYRDTELDGHVVLFHSKEELTIRSILLHKGYYHLRIWAFHEAESQYTVALDMLLNSTVDKNEEDFSWFPKFKESYGPVLDISEKGFGDERYIVSSFRVENGRGNFTIEVDNLVEVTTILERDKDILLNRNVAIERRQNYIIVWVIVPSKGFYRLSIWSKYPEEVQYSLAINILVESLEDIAFEDWELFPSDGITYGRDITYVQRGFDDSLDMPSSYICEKGEFLLTLITIFPPDIMAIIYTINDESDDDYVLLEQTDDDVTLKARFLHKGYYRILIYSKLHDATLYSHALVLLIYNKEKSKIKDPFPRTTTKTLEYRCKLITPTVRYINKTSNSQVNVQIQSPKLESIIVNGKLYEKEIDDYFNFDIETEYNGTVNLYGSIEGGDYFSIYEFEVF